MQTCITVEHKKRMGDIYSTYFASRIDENKKISMCTLVERACDVPVHSVPREGHEVEAHAEKKNMQNIKAHASGKVERKYTVVIRATSVLLSVVPRNNAQPGCFSNPRCGYVAGPSRNTMC